MLAIGSRNTVPLGIYALISAATPSTLFALGRLTTGASFLIIIVTSAVVTRRRRRRGDSLRTG